MIALVVGLGGGALAGLGGARLLAAGAAADPPSRATEAARAFLCGFAALVLIEAALGLAGALTAGATAVALLAVGSAVAVAARRRTGAAAVPPRERWHVQDTVLCVAIAAVLAERLWSGTHRASYFYDALSYHLHVPATWMHHRRLEIVPAVFGDPAPAYAPGNLELAFLFLMAPLRSDYLAGVGQLPFAALAAVAIVAAVREAGGRRDAALAAALVFLLVPEVHGQIAAAMADLGLAALLLASLAFIHRLHRLHRLGRNAYAGDLIAAALALGLAVGSKTVGLVLAVPFAIAAVFVAARARRFSPSAWLTAGAALVGGGGFWYARTAILTGNPVYPIAALGLPGLYGAATMRAWEYHLPIADVGALAAMLADAGTAFVLAALLAVVAAPALRRAVLEPLLAIASLALFWLVVPYQESRFLFSTFGLAAIAMARLASGARPAVSLAPARATPRARAIAVAVAGAAALGLTVALAIGARAYAARDPAYTVGDGLEEAWRWFRAQVRGERVAYTGNNLAFPLAGVGLANDVFYVNVAGAPGARLHDFSRRAAPTPTPEPAPYRDGADFAVWTRNLRAAGATVLFVAAMYPIVRRTIAADADGFPVERAWADVHPELFRLRYASPAARVYALSSSVGEPP